MKTRTPRNRQGKRRSGWTKAELDHLVEEAIVHCYIESEQLTGFYTMLKRRLER